MTFLKACGRWTRFRHFVAPVLGSEQQNWLCHPLPLFMAVIRVDSASGIRGEEKIRRLT